MKKFFSYDPDTGMARHDTAEEAKVSAQSAIDMYRDVAGDPDTGWPEEVEGVCWGEIRQQAKERDTTEETGMGFETCDYELTEIDESAQACVIGVVEETADLRRQLAEAQAAAEGANAAMLNYRAEALEAQARLAELDGERYEQLEREHLGDAEKQTGIYFTSPADQKDAARWINPNDKTQKQYLPHIGEPVLFTHGGRVFFGSHTGGSFTTGSGICQQHFPTWDCLWMPLPAAPDAAMLAASHGGQQQPPGADDFIPWGGGGCPVQPTAIVDVQHRSGLKNKSFPAHEARWTHIGSPGDIIAYRLAAADHGRG